MLYMSPPPRGRKRRATFMKKYDDIINLPHHVSKEHPQMSMYMRAAQFAPFAALAGHDSALEETSKAFQIEHDTTGYENDELS